MSAAARADERMQSDADNPPPPGEQSKSAAAPGAADLWQAEAAPPLRAGVRASLLVKTILARATEPWISLTVGGDVLEELRLGSFATITGAPGAGKTTLALTFVVEHLQRGGVVVFLSLELDGDELAARIVCFRCASSWKRVLRGEVPEAEMHRVLDLPRFSVLEGDAATLPMLEVEIEAMRAEFPDAPVLVVADYLQIMPNEDDSIRQRVANNVQALRRLAKRLRVVVLGISQPSRAAGKALAAGELTGAETMGTGAETAEIERAAYLTLAIGAAGPVREDGTRHVELSVGKGRFGGGDRVWPMSETPQTGLWRIAGEAKAAAEVKAERTAERDSKALNAAELAIVGLLDKSPAPMSVRDIRGQIGGTATVIGAAVRALVDRGELVHHGRARGGVRPVWVPARVAAADHGAPAELDESAKRVIAACDDALARHEGGADHV